ncbi:unnamed protein product [Soboliphyme baturini]|uniref:HOOK domain-containing protein n=1 Tax=Soboliphyme baturini TaxID=241478 RepID=A0A183I9B1_9BILA|nr:unnamed protein product [Soboliphyme baturini]
MKTEIKALTQKCAQFDAFQSDYTKRVEDNQRELNESHLLIQQYEAKMKSLMESMKDVENKKRQLEEAIDALNEECAKLKAQEKVAEVGMTPSSDAEVKAALESQLESHREAHAKQLAALRNEIDEKNKTIEQLRL